MTAPAGLTIAGETLRLPPGSRQVMPPGAIRPVPGAPPGLLGLTVQDGQVLPAWAGDDAPTAWVRLEGGLIGGSGFAEALPDAPLLALPTTVAPPFVAPAASPPPPPRAALAKPPALAVLRLGPAALQLPMQALAGIRPWPQDISPVPGAPPGAAGYVDSIDGPLLLLTPLWCYGTTGAPEHVAVLRHAGRQFGLPCGAVAPGLGGEPMLPRLDTTPEGQRLLALAPRIRPQVEAPPRPRRSLLLCRAGGVAFFLPAEAVEAVMPPQRPLPLPVGGAATDWLGACAHRGAVLPVADAARHLGPVPLPAAPPLLRLAGTPAMALAVSDILGLRAIPEDSITSLEDDGLVLALAVADGHPIPLCRAHALAGRPA
jgi:chemotaxis signal transduction protein